MIHRSLAFFLQFTVAIAGWAQNFNMTLTSSVAYSGQTCAGVWGYVDSLGNEYALVGASQGMAIVDVSVPAVPVKVTQIPGPDNKWKEIRTWNGFAYISNELDSGLQIVDLRNLPGTNLPSKYWQPTIDTAQLQKIHALEVANGYLYLHGSNIGNRGTLIVDISDPWNPVYKGKYDQNYVHDGYVRNDTLYSGNINDGIFSVIDVSNKSTPVLLATQNTPKSFTHNTWLSDDGKTLFITDEKDGSFLTSYDITNLGNITELDRIPSYPGPSAIVHNVYIHNDWAVTACNSDGINIVDAHRPGNLVLSAAFDTYTAGNGGGGIGVWGVYPFLPSGILLAASRDGYLHILDPNYIRACYLEGQVTDSATGSPLVSVGVKILGTNVLDSTKLNGNYATGVMGAGTYTVEFSKAGYNSQTKIVSLNSGSVVILNVKMTVLPQGVNLLEDDQVVLQAYPNPFKGKLQVVYRLPISDLLHSKILILDHFGRRVAEKELNLSAGSIQFDHQLSRGNYTLHLMNNGQLLKAIQISGL